MGQVADGRGRPLEDHREDGALGDADLGVDVGHPPREEVVEDRADGVDVGGRADFRDAAAGLLGGHVTGRADDVPVHREERRIGRGLGVLPALGPKVARRQGGWMRMSLASSRPRTHARPQSIT